MWPMFKFLFDTNVSEDNLRVEYMRSILKVGYPISMGPTYGDSPDWNDYDEEGWNKYSDWIYQIVEDLKTNFPKDDYKTYSFASNVLTDDVF